MEDIELEKLLRYEDKHYLGSVDLIAASNAPTATVRANTSWGVAQFRSAEGYPGRRPYAGCANIDAVEQLAIRRVCKVFDAEHANVQPLSGSLANLAAYRAVLQPGDTLLSLSMNAGGHLSHGHPKHLVSSKYKVVHYSVDPITRLLNYDEILLIARQERPKAIVAGYSAYPRVIDFTRFAEIAHDVGAKLIADISHIAGLVAAGLHENPSLTGAIVTTSVEKTLRGTRGGFILCPAALRSAVDTAVFPGLQSSVGLAGLVSLCLLLSEIGSASFRRYQERVVQNARFLGSLLSDHGIPLVTGGTDTHMIVLDVYAIGLTGRDAEKRLEEIGILSNRNLLPFDPLPPFKASGLRLGTPTITARGYDESDIREVSEIIASALLADGWENAQRNSLRDRVSELAWQPRAEDTLKDLYLRVHS
ncbi:serine hydroxymethyltransferase [Nostoc sp. CHAB 5784]|uniref:serine hydroxymethyltransferase n=1 Tax=Nostoc mirabile TaxID=2907820 RepID=UPI001E4F18D3|nr:serine hydroxymethyltransferase [Nostoc mirabile]MCC5669495.1 serine hydroxymethyltransferase [Nostoc mirabile CHAB5784]